jgi:hypothetical protein
MPTPTNLETLFQRTEPLSVLNSMERKTMYGMVTDSRRVRPLGR